MNTDVHTILIVEDEPDLAALLKQYVENEGYRCHVIGNGKEVEKWLENNNPALVVLDLMLPGKSGLDICKDIRAKNSIPIIITTAKIAEIDRLIGLELGADDYICKPYSPREVIARIKTVLRRSAFNQKEANTDDFIKIDTSSLHIEVKGKRIELTKIELNLFKLLFEQPGKIFSRQHILDNIYHDYRIVSDRTVDSHIKKLRRKLHEAIPELELIKSIYGVGYKFEPDVCDGRTPAE